jgi:hypothetical protein
MKIPMGMPEDETPRTRELARQMMELLCESEGDGPELAHAALYVMCAMFATSGVDTADLVEHLSEEIRELIDGNREQIAKINTVN